MVSSHIRNIQEGEVAGNQKSTVKPIFHDMLHLWPQGAERGGNSGIFFFFFGGNWDQSHLLLSPTEADSITHRPPPPPLPTSPHSHHLTENLCAHLPPPTKPPTTLLLNPLTHPATAQGCHRSESLNQRGGREGLLTAETEAL